MAPRLDLNADAGESYGHWSLGDDAALFRVVSSVNLALGFHAGDPLTLVRSVQQAAAAGLKIGAHPGYPDLPGFGRRELAASPDEIAAMTIYQVGALQGVLRAGGHPELSHIKAHGALYFRVHGDPAAGAAFVAACRAVAPQARLTVLAGPAGDGLAAQAQAAGLVVWREAFPERGYLASGVLAPRQLPGSTIAEPAEAAARAVAMARGEVVALDGTRITLTVQTVCIHGDHPQAAAVARAVRAALEQAGTQVGA